MVTEESCLDRGIGILESGKAEGKDVSRRSIVYEGSEPERRAWLFGVRRGVGQKRLRGHEGPDWEGP